MRVTLVTALDPFADEGGGARSLTMWLSRLVKEGHKVDVLTYGNRDDERRHGCFVKRFSDTNPISPIESYLRTEDVDVVLTQWGWSDIALWATDRNDVPCVLCVMSDFELNASSGIASGVDPDHIISVSDAYRARAEAIYDCETTTVYQPIDFDYYTVDQRNPETYTLVNPVELKGGSLFKQLALRRPNEPFLAKRGWGHLRNEDSSFNREYYDIASRTVNSYVPSPDEPDLDGIQNLEYVRDGDIRDIYRRTKVLLVPSQWDESFGRVIVEAMANGIPVVASDVGGIPESCGGAGLLVEDYENIDEWDHRLDMLADKETYQSYAEQALDRAAEYRHKKPDEVDEFVRIITQVGQST